MQKMIVAGIGTEVGKTVVSAILVKMLGGNYWKPVSCGPYSKRDPLVVEQWIEDPTVTYFPEAYHLNAPLSPHHAARLQGVDLDPEKVVMPFSSRPLIIESCGGVMVPFNDHMLTIDLFASWDCDWVVVSKNYLGSINHTLLTIEALKARGITPLGIIFNGEENLRSETFILNHTKLPMLARIREESDINSKVIWRYSESWKKTNFHRV